MVGGRGGGGGLTKARITSIYIVIIRAKGSIQVNPVRIQHSNSFFLSVFVCLFKEFVEFVERGKKFMHIM